MSVPAVTERPNEEYRPMNPIMTRARELLPAILITVQCENNAATVY